MKLAELLYRGINRLRRALYRAGILRPRRLPVPVISVGNIAAGGGGKTPTVIAIARVLAERGLRVGILTRGYGRTGEGGLVDALDPDRFGDEPVLMKKSLPKDVQVIVGVNRYENALLHSCDVYVLDDGFQHLKLHRDLDIVLDVANAAFFREGRGALSDADIVLPRRLESRVPDGLRGRPVFAFAGLADNEQFFESLRRSGVQVNLTRSFPDHHRYSPADLADIKRAANGLPIVTTEKDAVKITDPEIIAIPAEVALDAAVLTRIAAVANSALRS